MNYDFCFYSDSSSSSSLFAEPIGFSDNGFILSAHACQRGAVLYVFTAASGT
jgi:hypothetical protein